MPFNAMRQGRAALQWAVWPLPGSMSSITKDNRITGWKIAEAPSVNVATRADLVAAMEAADLGSMRYSERVAFGVRARLEAVDREAMRRGVNLFAPHLDRIDLRSKQVHAPVQRLPRDGAGRDEVVHAIERS